MTSNKVEHVQLDEAWQAQKNTTTSQEEWLQLVNMSVETEMDWLLFYVLPNTKKSC